ncbi:pyruvate ferredoxin oxidoreductase subunit alpha [Tepiditoga spiralis]|uniref:Pyruvate ferredoxin oxidoreductase subunit alpha n=2 Tax=Tepiditoga spiralis TaxID=2108365 RepID=A0A7G1G502_9BACT|nr:transketolase C-terminal domain-containing protein [Tepiditoga spiralis]BBE29967.1 pyruvate ferredoxin oxidoreductase subunit alpha [Tepiditoga spiralis]
MMKKFVSGDEAVAMGVRLARPHVISAYPITPQTIVVERLSEMVEDKSLKAEFLHVESEHSAMAAAMGVSSVGARAFTATSSQGLLYMSEVMHYVSGARFPIVMMNANRSIAVPWSIYGDQRDSLSQLDSGWIQVYVEDAQEALDMIIQAYKIAENKDVLTPMMVNLDGFVLTHTYELINLPNQEKVDEFLPPIDSIVKMDINDPKSLCFSTSPEHNMEFKYKQHVAMLNAKKVIEEVDKEYGDMFGRYYDGLIEEYKTTDAEVLLLTVGSITGTARVVIDKLRKNGQKVGLIKLRYLRPFPEEELQKISSKAKVLGVLEKDVSFGYEGTVFTNVSSALSKLENQPQIYNFLGGMGGRDISKEDIEDIILKLIDAHNGKKIDRVQFVNLKARV